MATTQQEDLQADLTADLKADLKVGLETTADIPHMDITP